MRRIFVALAILLALGNSADAKNYITLESPAGNTIVDETGKWILGPYKDLHVNYCKSIIHLWQVNKKWEGTLL